MITKDSTVVKAKDQISSELDGEEVILNIKSGVYYGLNSVGASIWHLIQQSKTVSKIQDAILTKYAVDPQQCESDLLSMLQQLEAEGLIEVSHETSV